jgi:putative salt-induced outer membrane protein
MKSAYLAGVAAAVGVGACLAASPALADWKGKGEFGLVLSRGNSDAETLNAKVDAGTEIDRWTHTVGFSALRASANDETTANRYELRGQTNYALTDRSYVFGALRYEDDRFSAFDYQATGSAGYGYKFIDTEATKLTGQLGVGYRVAEVRLTGEREDDAVLRGDLAFQHQFTATTRLINKFLVEAGSSNTFLQNELAVEVKMTDRLALSVAHAVRHNSDVPDGVAKTDQLTTANIVFAF